MTTLTLTVAQATIRFLAQQYTRRDGVEQRLVEGFLGIFGHGNVAGLGQALLEAELTEPGEMPYILARNEQGAVNAAVAFAKDRDRLSTMAVTTSVGPGAMNMVTGAALATTNRIPVLLLPADVFANRRPDPVLQQLERPQSRDVTVNDAFRAVSVFFDRVWRPEQLPAALLEAARVLADPTQAGAVVVAMPEDVQAEAYDWPEELFRRRVWTIARTPADPDAVAEAAALIGQARHPLIVAGGGVHYSRAGDALASFAARLGIPVGQTHAGKGVLPHGHPMDIGGLGSTGTTAATALAAEADLVIGIGTRYSDFTTASMSLFARPGVRFVNLNITPMDGPKLSGMPLLGDARAVLAQLDEATADVTPQADHLARVAELRAEWNAQRDAAVTRNWAAHSELGLPSQAELIGILNDELGDEDVIVNAAGSAPGDLHRLWQPRSPRQYHVEYAFSTMGYEVAGALGVKLSDPSRQVVALVGDGSYLMLSQELVTAVAERRKLVVVLVDNRGYASIGNLSESVGSQRFGTKYRYRDAASGRLDGDALPVDYAANLRSLGVEVFEADSTQSFREALRQALTAEESAAVYVRTDPLAPAAPGGAWWDVPVAEVSTLATTQQARAQYERDVRAQRWYL
ncbi:3D-(3,5/4)-trihydroxycyclohexane-1,2-dione acylhydrolase (decyclizing) [Microbacterium protaetiae]|uniref:3D-(3,5/4)-trihydroxycyclohexane-1,2-dione acylhydrolase (Decyclizing) n=1 Tax=Microbacterium protaetiae TaxID=2509458 RepID=A0A4P6EMT8_9MICO|nr:3D-(3,5/4)-trihydroxycyclohexane-1,2-dione acylhydrolase (decyclizing) [Microbacterium protaetiae]QAY59188.1 3D-(3,5/4)-trihydroxycyclohexane-1,2-dione acylhydrolase (decyclizing) [Microbacterium protaetiae]